MSDSLVDSVDNAKREMEHSAPISGVGIVSEHFMQGLDKHPVVEAKELRVAVDEIIQRIRQSKRQSAEKTLALRKLQEGVMWLGMELKALKEAGLADDLANPYPNSYDPSNTKVEPTADGLKL